MANKHILIIGTGSAGKRHARNLRALGCRVSCMDSRQDRLDEAARTEGIDMVAGYTTLEAALEAGGFDGAVVASPTAFHVEQCLACLERDIPILLEKPVAPTLAEARRLGEALERGAAPLLLGYTWRWWPALKRVREHLRKGTVGTLRHVSFVMSAHLADWHPWERYQDFFMASREQGGGALLDESHWIDQMIWLAGMPSQLSGQVGKISDLEIDSDDNVDILALYPDGLRISMHLDLYGRPHEKSIKFVGEEGTLRWEVEELAVGKTMDQQWKRETFDNDRNDMFVEVAREFLRVIDGEIAPSCTVLDGIRVMEIIEAVRQSTASGALIQMG